MGGGHSICQGSGWSSTCPAENNVEYPVISCYSFTTVSIGITFFISSFFRCIYIYTLGDNIHSYSKVTHFSEGGRMQDVSYIINE